MAEQSYRCLSCGAMFARHFPACASCWSRGQIIPVGRRPQAQIDSMPAASTARDLARLSWESVDQAAYPALKLSPRSLVEVSGEPGGGKSTFTTRLADGLAGPALLVSSEEGLGPSLQARLARCGVKRADFHLLSRATVDQVVAYATAHKVRTLVIDSVQESAWTARELRHVLGVIPSLTTLLAVLQVNKSGSPAGAMALQHEADVHVFVEQMTWRLIKSRYQALDTAGGAVLPHGAATLPRPMPTDEERSV